MPYALCLASLRQLLSVKPTPRRPSQIIVTSGSKSEILRRCFVQARSVNPPADHGTIKVIRNGHTPGIPWQKVSSHRSRGIGRDKAADFDITAKTDIPNDGFAKRVSGVSNDRLFRHLPPQTIDWNPISSRSHVVLRAMPIGNVAAGNASRTAHAFEPCANVVGYIFKLSAINRVSRSGEEGQRRE
jgi:hypothetical protein